MEVPRWPRCSPEVRERNLAAFEHQDVPFEEVLDQRLNPLARGRIFRVQVVLAWRTSARAFRCGAR